MKTTLGVDIGGTGIKLGVVRKGKVIVSHAFPTARISKNPKILIDGLVQEVRDFLKDHTIKVDAVGVGVPGLVNFHKGVVHSCANLPGWKNVPLQTILKQRLGKPVVIDNDARAFTLAEWQMGAGHGVTNLVCVTLGTGVGGGFVINREIYRSTTGPSSEIGHLIWPETAGQKPFSFLETNVGNGGIIQLARQKMRKRPSTKLKKILDGKLSDLTPWHLTQAAKAGDALSLQVWDEIGSRIAWGLVQVSTLLNPDKIVIGGGVAQAGKWVFQPIRKHFKQNIMTGLEKIPIVRAKCGPQTGLIGAALLPYAK